MSTILLQLVAYLDFGWALCSIFYQVDIYIYIYIPIPMYKIKDKT